MKQIIVAIFLFSLLWPARIVQAANTKLIEYQNDALFAFPDAIQFTADLSWNTDIKKARLHYGSLQDSCGQVGGVAYPEFEPGKRIKVTWEWDMRQSGGEPPGAVIWWFWELTDSQDKVHFTSRQEKTWIDDWNNWKTLSEGLIRLHYYHPNKSYGEELKDTAVNALERLEKDIGIAPENPIDLYIYTSTQDMRDAIFYEPGWTGGLAYPEYNILTIGIDPSDMEWGKVTEAHELTHVLVGDFAFSCLGSIPTWLNEGLAVYGEGGPSPYEAANFDQNRVDDSLLSFTVLSGGFSEDPAVADLSYSQSYYMVEYLLRVYGKDKMLALLVELKNSGKIDESLQKVYRFSLIEFEDEWRASLGLNPRPSTSTTILQTPTVVPTVHPIGSDSGSSKTESRIAMQADDDPKGTSAPRTARSTLNSHERLGASGTHTFYRLLLAGTLMSLAGVFSFFVRKTKRGMK